MSLVSRLWESTRVAQQSGYISNEGAQFVLKFLCLGEVS